MPGSGGKVVVSEQVIDPVALPVLAAVKDDEPVTTPVEPPPPPIADGRISWSREAKFLGVHVVAAIGAWFIPPTRELVLLALAAYFGRMFFITAGYHRYFAHRAYKTSRW